MNATRRHSSPAEACVRMDDFADDLDAIAEAAPASAPKALFRETCRKCGGSGRYAFHSTLGPSCFACAGRGFNEFATSPEYRAGKRAKATAKKAGAAEAKRAQLAAKAAAYREANPEVSAWMNAAADRGFGFATSMQAALTQWGCLTAGQEAACRRFMEQDGHRAIQAAERVAAAPTCDVGRLEAAFNMARGNGVARPMLRLDAFTFKPAPEHGKNAGAIYVTQDDAYLGKVQAGRFLVTRDCDAGTQARIVAAAGDPKAAAIAYGQREGRCSVCGRTLTDEASIEAAIGPVCAEKWGW